MAASNYIDSETDMESIWDFQIVTAKFALIGIKMAEILNHRINNDATQQVTDTAHIPILKQISEECMHELIAAAKETAVEKPWDFIQANVMNFMRRRLDAWKEFLDEIQISQTKKYSYTETDRYSYDDSGVGLIRRTT